ncbi:MAG: phytanoyl-CoA dioxygenase family protein [Bryobacterales bacterium]|nr:phytanoyl-CoA dioxygenase family protein [Bryobacterales bacterium]
MPGWTLYDAGSAPPHPKWIHARDRYQFATNGYMVIRNVIPESLVANAVRDIADFVGADLADSGTWYRAPAVLDGVVPMHHAQSFWEIRQHPNLYQVFSEHFGTGRLRVDINRCMFRPPVHPKHPTRSLGDIHWDTDPQADEEPTLQAVVLLSPIGNDRGGFQCIPEIYRNLRTWLKENLRTDEVFDFRHAALRHPGTIQVEANAGDIIIWSTKLPHGSAVNRSSQPRMAMFVTLQPPQDSQALRDQIKELWLTKRAPEHWRDLPSQLDPEPGPPAELTELGRKLLGLHPW